MIEINSIKLSELTKKIEDAIKQTVGADFYWVIAEISGHKFYPNQDRHYFEFVEKVDGQNEPIAKVGGVSWFDGSQHIKLFEIATGQKFTNGIQVLVKVKVEFHQSFGFSLVLHDIDQSFTLGNLEKQRRETLLRLVSENPSFIKKVGEEFITLNKNLKLSLAIQNIAIIGSPNSEGYTDFIHTISSNQFGYKFSIDIYQSSVQGAEAEKELIKKLIDIYNSKIKYDCVVIIRGGGEKTDFIVFDTYNLSRAVAKFPIPIITGIGHHKDVSVVDLMTNTSTKTPTKAAEFIISHNRSLEDLILILQKEIIIKSQQLLSKAIEKINAINIVIINKSRTFISRHKDILNDTNLIITNNSRTFISRHKDILNNTNIIITNNSRTFLNHKKDGLNNLNQIIINKTKTIIYNRQTNLVSLLNKFLSRPKIITANKNAELSNLIGNLKIFSNKYFINHRVYLRHYETMVKVMSPQNILKRGFAIVSRKGKILKNSETIIPGNELTITMESFDINTKVISKTKNNGRETIV